MPKPLQTQWDFGKPAGAGTAPAVERRVFSVAEITAKIRTTLESQIGHAWVSGEITNFRLQTSGHIYFTLKDPYAQISCVLFKADARSIDRSILKDGQTIVVHGELSVYEVRGQYQLRVVAIELQGQGKLQAGFERLKQKLNAEGLFAAARKRPIPKHPHRIGLVTSRDGAALHDVLHVIERRQPGLELILAPCRVQGPGAAQEIAASIRLLNDWSQSNPDRALDLILVTRGGGSLEDLWAFNEELTARAIVASNLPVISAVGHEIDFTISDFAADFRAATPSAAAELITEGAISSRQRLGEIHGRLGRIAGQRLARARGDLESGRAQLDRRHPARLLRERQQNLDELRETLQRCAAARLGIFRERFRQTVDRFQRLRLRDRLRREKTHLEQLRLRPVLRARVENARRRLAALESQLRLLGPQQTLDRGYSITTDAASGKILRNVAEMKKGQRVKTRLAQGEFDSVAD
jgi:exodeoxyribonuclease VII large subunit